MNFFTEVWDKLSLLFTEAGKILWPLIERLLKDEGQMLLASAKDAVLKVAASPNFATMTWEEKLSMAVGLVTADVMEKGLQIATTDIINAVQVVVTSEKTPA